jgi:hypothetical protein
MERKEAYVPNVRQPKVERQVKYLDTFARKTIYIENNLLWMIQELSSNRRGEQTRIINAALSEYFASDRSASYSRPDKSDLARKTVYIEKNLLAELMELNARGYEQVQLIHNALSSYLSDPDNIEKHAGASDWYSQPFWKELKIGKIELND